ncbi:hypothetical protein MP228_011953 [Amoeboaphelidium protococcarum]|nr:hypothetical protein MP228_011953 [Amoeboaphelidium protococcarum]
MIVIWLGVLLPMSQVVQYLCVGPFLAGFDGDILLVILAISAWILAYIQNVILIIAAWRFSIQDPTHLRISRALSIFQVLCMISAIVFKLIRNSVISFDAETIFQSVALVYQCMSVVLLSWLRRKAQSSFGIQYEVDQEFDVTDLFVITIAVAALYLSTSSLLFTLWLEPHLSAFDSVYFLVTSFTSIGYGDISPSGGVSRIVFDFVSLAGLLLFGLSIYSIRRVVLMHLTSQLQYRLTDLLDSWLHVVDSGLDVEGQALLHAVNADNFNDEFTDSQATWVRVFRCDLNKALSDQGHSNERTERSLEPNGQRDEEPDGDYFSMWQHQQRDRVRTMTDSFCSGNQRYYEQFHRNESKNGNNGYFRDFTMQPSSSSRFVIPLTPSLRQRFQTVMTMPVVEPKTMVDQIGAILEDQNDEHELQCRWIVMQALKRALIRRFELLLIIVSVYWIVFCVSMMLAESWNFLDSFHYVYVTVTTIGLGDMKPATFYGKVSFMSHLLVGLPLITYFGSLTAELLSIQYRLRKLQTQVVEG